MVEERRDIVMNKKTKKIIKTVIPILKKYSVTKAGVFGSLVRGDLKKDSDIDILIKIPDDANLDLLDFVHMKHEIEDSVGREIDLIEYSTIKPILRKNVLKEEIRIL
ncbi:MAG: nucleotidyltransferase domain-containing protein [Elusimicrobia bacterium]|jgi:predicted nucleotidyltransferase|nr:nucleotidyltransferase domain-containing protein [Elusimicrobiota bacterium]